MLTLLKELTVSSRRPARKHWAQQTGEPFFLLMSIHPPAQSLHLTAPSGHERLKVTRLAPEFAWEIPGFQEPLPSNSYPESPTEVPPLPFPVRHSRCDPRLSHSSGPAPPPCTAARPFSLSSLFSTSVPCSSFLQAAPRPRPVKTHAETLFQFLVSS